jgi:hypothetical protein
LVAVTNQSPDEGFDLVFGWRDAIWKVFEHTQHRTGQLDYPKMLPLVFVLVERIVSRRLKLNRGEHFARSFVESFAYCE